MIPTWCGTWAPAHLWRLVLAGWIRHLTRKLLNRLDPSVPGTCPMCSCEEQQP